MGNQKEQVGILDLTTWDTNKSSSRTGRSRRTGKRSRVRGQVGILDLTTGRQTTQTAGQAGHKGQESTADKENK